MILGIVVGIFETEPDKFYLKFYMANDEVAYIKIDADKMSNFPIPENLVVNGLFDIRNLISLQYFLKYRKDSKGVNRITYLKDAFHNNVKLLPSLPVRIESFYPVLSSMDAVIIREMMGR